MDDDGEKPWTHQLLVGVGALLAVALVIGGVVSAFALGAARVSGIDDARPEATVEPSLVIPSSPSDASGPSSSVSPTPPSTSPRPTPPRKPPITLEVGQDQVEPGGRIDLSGSYPRGEGAELQVQRFDGGWTDFPVTVPVSGGRFSTYVQTTRTGPSRFRVLDTASGRASNPVRVVVG